MTVKRYLQKHNIHEILQTFCLDLLENVMVLVGLEVVEQSGEKRVERDLAVFSMENKPLRDCIVNKLKTANKCKGLDLELIEEEVEVPGVIYFRQLNYKLTRKHIIPLIESAVRCYTNASSETTESVSSDSHEFTNETYKASEEVQPHSNLTT